jgi:DNA-binding response OmpR family regulator
MTSPLPLVSVVESEETLRESVCRAIRLDGCRADAFADGGAAWDSFGRALPDLAIVDTAIRGEPDALTLCRRLRERSATLPLIVVLAREEELEPVLDQGLEADDYLSRPFSLQELLLRVKVLLRRASLTGAETLAWEDRPLTLGPLTVDPLRLRAGWSGSDLALTATEFFLLHSLVRRAGVVKTRDQLMQDAFPGRSGGDRGVDSHIERMRRKFERLEPHFDALEGVHGAGYRYRAGPSKRGSGVI